MVPGKLPANVIVAPNSPSARAQASTAPATSAGRIAGSVTRRNTYHRDAAERPRRVLEAPVELAQRGLDGEHQERHRHERLGDDHAPRRERQPDVEPAVEVLAEQPAPPEREEQRDAADDRRQHHRQRAQGAHDAAPGEVDPGQQPRQRHAEHERERRSATASSVIDSHSAVRTSSLGERRPSAVLHGARHSSPTNGSAKNSTAIAASTNAGTGQSTTSGAATSPAHDGAGHRTVQAGRRRCTGSLDPVARAARLAGRRREPRIVASLVRRGLFRRAHRQRNAISPAWVGMNPQASK